MYRSLQIFSPCSISDFCPDYSNYAALLTAYILSSFAIHEKLETLM